MDQIPGRRRLTRPRAVAAGVAGVYVAFVIFAQLIGEDESAASREADELRWGGFCSVISSGNYPMLVRTLSSSGGLPGRLDPDSFGVYDSFYAIVDEAPEEFRDETRHLVDGLDQAINGNLSPSQVEDYIQRYDELSRAAEPMCSDVDPAFGEPRDQD